MSHIPDRYCHNCHQPLASPASSYCDNCGQKYTTGRITFRSLMVDLFDAIFNFDSRILRTLRAIWSPGKLSIAYFKGRHRRYLHPIRLFLVMAVVHFTVIGFVIGPKLDRDLRESEEERRQEVFRAELRTELDSLEVDLIAESTHPQAVRNALDSLYERTGMPDDFYRELSYLKYNGFLSVSGESVEVDAHDYFYTPVGELVEKQEFDDWLSVISFSQLLKIEREGASAGRYFLGQLIWLATLMIVFLALWLKLLYIRHRIYLVEHAVFVLHFFSFAFMLGSLAIILKEGDDRLYDWSNGFFIGLSFLWVWLYLYKSMKRFYGQDRFKRVAKWLLTSSMYLVFFVFAITLVSVISAIFF